MTSDGNRRRTQRVGIGRVDTVAALVELGRGGAQQFGLSSQHRHDVALGDVIEEREQLVATRVCAERPGRDSSDRRPRRDRDPRRAGASRAPQCEDRAAVAAHPAETVQAGAPHQVEQHRLGLIVSGVAEERVVRQHARLASVLELRDSGPARRAPVPTGTGPRTARAAAATRSASAVDSARRPWSTCTAVTTHPPSTARANIASESAPPDTAHVTGVPAEGNGIGRPVRSRGRPTRGSRSGDAGGARRDNHADGSRISAIVGRFSGRSHARSRRRRSFDSTSSMNCSPCSYCASLASRPINCCSRRASPARQIAGAGAGPG